MNKSFAHYFLTQVCNLFSVLFGKIKWNSPPWMSYLCSKAKNSPALFSGIIVGIVIFLSASLYAFQWYKNLPQPELVNAFITPPGITPLAEELTPAPLVIDFGIGSQENFNNYSAAPVQLIGKEVKEGLYLKPDMPGKWLWETDSRLVFTPAKDWPADQKYSIHFAKNFFASTTPMERFNYSFKTLPFEAKITEFKFYQDPTNPKNRKAIATIDFNFPVDPASLETNTSLMLQSLKHNKLDFNAKQYKFSLTYDEHKRKAYLHSENLTLPKVSRYLLLTLKSGIQARANSAITKNSSSENLLIPDESNYFKINTATASIIRNEQDRPEQILTLETSLGVAETELNKALDVYLLPENYPATAAEPEKVNYQWQNPGEVNAAILALAKPLSLQKLPSDRHYANLHSYKFNSPTPHYIFLKLKKGIRGFGDFALANDYSTIIKVPEFPKEISFIHKGALLALNSEKKLSVLVRGLPAVKFEIARVLPENVNQLVTQTQGDFNNPYFLHQSFNQYNISEIFSEIQQFDTTDASKQQYTALDLAKYLSKATDAKGPRGLFFLQATGWDTQQNIPLEAKANRLILMTDLALVVKDNNDGSHDVFVQSISQGNPVANADVTILGKNGLAILTRKTDNQGRANFPNLNNYSDDREPTAYLASLDSDVSFIPYSKYDRQLNYSRYDVGGIYSYNQELHNLSAYLFSDRGIYRPGDQVHLGIIVKRAYAQSQQAGLPLQITVTDPRGNTIHDKKLTLNSDGFFSFDFLTQSTSPTGQYTANLYIVKDSHPENLLGSTTIRVAEFQPDRMRIRSNLSQNENKGWISPAGLTANVDLWNLYGAPASERKITAKIILAPQRIHFSQYPHYIFSDPLQDPTKAARIFTDNLNDSKTDANGKAHFDLHLERFAKATYMLTFFAEGFESEGGRSVAAQSTALVSPLPYFVGYKTDGDLNFIKQNAARSVHLIAVNPQLEQIPVTDLKVQLLSLHPVTTLVKKSDGTYQYQSIIKSTVVSTKPLSINKEGFYFPLPTDQIGDFAVNILDSNYAELSQFKFSVVGTSHKPLAKNAELSVKLNKVEYKAGEDIELHLTAPYSGAGLITIERDKVYASQWFKTETTSSVQKIHIPDDFQGDGYINVTFARNWDSPDIFISPLSYSINPFKVNHEAHAVKVDLDVPALAVPGETLTINYKTNKQGKIIIFAVDEGILQVNHYKTPDPLDFFFQKHALEVMTQQTIDQILPKFIQDRELSAVGGDGGEELLTNYLNPFKRKTDLPVVYWSGILESDDASRQVSYQVPDYFNGSLRVMAVAVANDAVGAVDKKTEVRGHFIINPNTPTFVAPGDEFEITASIANNVKASGIDAPIEVELITTPELEILSAPKENLTISENHEKTTHFKLRAKNQLGSAKISFNVKMGSKIARMDAGLSIRPSSVFTTTVTSGRTKDAHKTLILDRSLYSEHKNAEAALSTNPLILVSGLHRYLDNFPYGCTEQLTSKAMPLLAMAGQIWFEKDTQKITDKIISTIQMLGQRQMSSGAFSYWSGLTDNSNNNFATVYAMHFLTEAKAQNYNVSADIFSAGLAYLKDLATQNTTDLDKARIQAYAIYILTRNEIITTNYLSNLQLYLDKDINNLWQQEITGAYIAATYQLLKSFPEAKQLISQYKINTSSSQSNDFYNNSIADAQYLYLIARHFPERLSQLGEQLMDKLVNTINSNEINTILSSYISLALNAYGQVYPSSHNAPFSISEVLFNNKERTLIALNNQFEKVDLDGDAQKINFNNPTKQTYFYQLAQAGFDKKPATKVLKQGIEVYREYRDKNGNKIEEIKLGTEVEVHIQIRALDMSYLNNIAIVDLLPGGFEVVRDSVNNEIMDYADIREDRVVFFGSIGSSNKELVYRIKAINTGNYQVPAIFAESMYNPKIKAHGIASLIKVINE